MNPDVIAKGQQSIIDFLTPGMVWGFFALIAVLAGIMSIIIVWHWTAYGKGILRKIGVEIVYIAVTTGMVIALFIATVQLSAKL